MRPWRWRAASFWLGKPCTTGTTALVARHSGQTRRRSRSHRSAKHLNALQLPSGTPVRLSGRASRPCGSPGRAGTGTRQGARGAKNAPLRRGFAALAVGCPASGSPKTSMKRAVQMASAPATCAETRGETARSGPASRRLRQASAGKSWGSRSSQGMRCPGMRCPEGSANTETARGAGAPSESWADRRGWKSKGSPSAMQTLRR
mmetsp:Transcript_86014/g.256587  ORF Transcript_86014/g.256587 Transcript_86014/m.256587 type:complete len:204 (+) Transcript_86014:317-928(+)